RSWNDALARRPRTAVVANADDPLVAWAASGSADVTWVSAGLPWTHDATSCLACGGLIRFGTRGWCCTACPARRPDPTVSLAGRTVHSPWADALPLRLRVPGRCNVANATFAATAAMRLGVPPAIAADAAAAICSVDGRYSRVRVGDRVARLLLAKNPVGWMETFDILAPAPTPVVIVVNDGTADGRDVSWLWDVPFERLGRRSVVAAGTRAVDLGLRLRYAGVPHAVVPDPVDAI